MISTKIQNLFEFIEFLHSNIDNYTQFDEVINKLYLLDNERKKVQRKKNFLEKLKYDEIQIEIKSYLNVLKENITQPLIAKATELNVCDFHNRQLYWYGIETEIYELKMSFSKNDLPIIFNNKNMYLEYRTKTKGESFFELKFFFNELDEILKELFDYFKETELNEFEEFEREKIVVSSITEFCEIISSKNMLKFDIDNSLSISEKLDYWKSLIDKHLNEPLTKEFGEYEFTFEQENAKNKRLIELFGIDYKLVSPLFIPNYVYDEHFKNGLNEPEFTYWFLQYHAKNWFYFSIKLKHFNEKLQTPISEKFIKAELKKLIEFENKAEILLDENTIDIYKAHSYSEYANEIEYLRIKANYYKTHSLHNVHAIGLKTVCLYAEHIYLKEFLNNELEKLITIKDTSNKLITPTEPKEEKRVNEADFQNVSESDIFISEKKSKLIDKLKSNGFFELQLVKDIPELNRIKLIDLLNANKMAYGIAMFNFLGFCKYLDNEHKVKYKTDFILSRIFNEKAKDGTQAKHYRNSLFKNNKRYTSYLHKDKVINDYEQLK